MNSVRVKYCGWCDWDGLGVIVRHKSWISKGLSVSIVRNASLLWRCGPFGIEEVEPYLLIALHVDDHPIWFARKTFYKNRRSTRKKKRKTKMYENPPWNFPLIRFPMNSDKTWATIATFREANSEWSGRDKVQWEVFKNGNLPEAKKLRLRDWTMRCVDCDGHWAVAANAIVHKLRCIMGSTFFMPL